MALPPSLPGLNTREAVVDAVYRAVTGLDTADRTLFDSAIAKEGRCDINGDILDTPEKINTLYEHVAALDTHHSLSNIRVEVQDGADTAKLSAYVTAQHCRGGEGGDPKAPKLCAGGMYLIEVVKDVGAGLWKMKEWKLQTIWREGDPSVMTGALKG